MSVCSLADYYADRAAEYDDVYRKLERQHDLARLKRLLPPLVAGKRVVLKNFPSRERLTADLAPAAADVAWTELEYFWLASCVLR